MKVGACVVIGAVGLGLAGLVSCGQPDRGKPADPAAMPARPVSVARAQTRAIARTIGATGSLAAQEQATLSAKVAGRLERLEVDIGSELRQGDLVAQIEPRDYELGLQEAAAALAQARAALGLPIAGDDDRIELEQVTAVRQARAVLEEAAKNRERVQRLSGSGIASQSEVDTVEATYTVAAARYDSALEEARGRMATVAQRRAEFDLARKRLADASVRAPFDGAVQARPATIGEYVAVGVPIVRLVKTARLRLRLDVPERECARVRVGQVVQLHVEGDSRLYTGQIARLSPALDEQTRTLRVEADVPRQGSLRPGLFARAQIVVAEADPALTVPEKAVITFAGLEKVVVVEDGRAVEKVVSTGHRGPDWVEIVSGLSAGETVVLNPGGLRTGQRVARPEAEPN
ncbi:MAG TPA: efflux RND transporter periplasmic adaptor subunit [Verrucomicrobiota bacterium]|nr:efflux RND transporter periplasmic adaptor subunit [Verrucomicrobiota bacterium]HRR65664.1 efflux RND transporter periplasmic adaptor subunit [Candidatus Paceibacterota bacterium]NLH83986.1 efflux RND transporter periplasmic adaptor subunit [Verrucomicrobiota bacterium]HNR70913.1 efflux RND transporter periplasmic adaptor subunit [Verrucomicrobiota bacterium]HNS69995.1 efflux RND transporter periplasmic adaptor subunit [Verrucomicrobiota bacterium]